jgi:glycosyltransferase involved in cell wall biosynthesis
MEGIKLTVIVPTYNRVDTLKKCLKALARQTFNRADYEIIVVDDGSNDGTADYLASLGSGYPAALRTFSQANRGPAAARNLGIKAARGKIVLFTGDDIIADSRLLAEHVRCHSAHPEIEAAVLGYTTWSKEIKITPFMRWLESRGVQFGYGQIAGKDEVDPWRFFYTSNISLKKEFFDRNGSFDEDFKNAAYEDIELGWRFKRKGLKLFYNTNAVGWHEHATSLDAACARMIKVGEAGMLYLQKIGQKPVLGEPKMSSLIKILKTCKFYIYYMLAKGIESRLVNESVYKYIMDYYYRIGARGYRGINK